MPGPRTYHTAKSKLLKNDNWIEENVDDGVLFSYLFFLFCCASTERSHNK